MRLSRRYRNAEKAQLLAEERFLVSSLEDIKRERKRLAIERRCLRRLQAKVLRKLEGEQGHGPNSPDKPVSPTTSSEPLPQNVKHFSTMTELKTETNEPQSEDTSCDNEKTDVTVSNSISDQVKNPEICAEEDDDESSGDDIILDMGMLIAGDGGNPPTI